MDDQTFRDFKRAANDCYPDKMVLRDDQAQYAYWDAVQAYSAGGDRKELFANMLSLGIDAQWIRYQGRNPHELIACITP
ncbi:hypothetical protein [Tardiphaga sp. vice278]|uniref:hypothetical protein n=1 Tax=Tardiphaga sp. vice278 TaxID=2592815 RepID=UPI001165828C|nr:hypothetical protein [Tardiphaga sp. vice278]QDM16836.1 hypothetical protein FNL53_13520 [Tardiphaga sp. vice278]